MNSSDYNDITGAPFISEIHYDNAGTDTGEFVEICAPNGTDVSTFTLYLYNGNNGETYNSFDLSTITACDGGDGNDYYVIDLPTNGIQNGAPDGLALVNGGAVCEFLSYEGTFTATNGPASGLTSTDIGVSQTGTTPVGSSLQVNPATGTWESFDDDTPKEQNQCYLKGTNILTDKGEIPIENLSIGDVVIDYRGTPRQIKWIGIQQITPDHNKFYEYQPVKVAAHALEQGVPSSDVSLSPDHAILVDDLLVNIGAIENGQSITKQNISESYTYYHIELDIHTLLSVHNLLAESFLPLRHSRNEYDNQDEYNQLYPEDNKIMLWPMSFPRVSSVYRLPRHLKERFGLSEAISA